MVERIKNYVLLERLAAGGMAEVYLAKQTSVGGFERLVCIKRILPHNCEQQDFITMFKDEARIVANLNHPNIAQIYELGTENDQYFLVLEYVEGDDLRSIYNKQAKQGRPVPVHYAAHIGMGVAAGLDYAHRKTDLDGEALGVVHRDISPQNILISNDGQIKIIDFGIAKATGRLSETRAGVLKGKYAYMSPEQACGDPIDGRTDIFALGVTLYEITTGSRLFRKNNELETLNAVIECQVTPPSTFVQSYDSAFESILMRALTANPDERFQTAGEFEHALQDYLIESGYQSRAATLADYVGNLNQREEELNTAAEADTVIEQTAATVLDVGPMQFDAPRSRGGTALLSSETENATEEGSEQAAQSGPEPTADANATVITQHPSHANEPTQVRMMEDTRVVEQPGPRPPPLPSPQSQSLKTGTVALLSLIGGLVIAASLAYLAKPANELTNVSGPVLIESRPAGAHFQFVGPGSGEWNRLYHNALTPTIIEEGLPVNNKWELVLKKPGFQPVTIKLPKLDPHPEPAPITVPLKITYPDPFRGTLTLVTTPRNAEIILNGQLLGKTTPVGHLELPANQHHDLILKLTQHRDHRQVIKLMPDEHKHLNIQLQPLSTTGSQQSPPTENSDSPNPVEVRPESQITLGYLSVDAPHKFRIFLGNKLIGVSPLRRIQLPIGRHELKLRNESLGLTLRRKIRIRPNSTTELNIDSASGYLSVNAKPWAKVRVGQMPPRETPVRIDLMTGTYEIFIECPNGYTHSKSVVIQESRTIPVTVDCQ